MIENSEFLFRCQLYEGHLEPHRFHEMGIEYNFVITWRKNDHKNPGYCG